MGIRITWRRGSRAKKAASKVIKYATSGSTRRRTHKKIKKGVLTKAERYKKNAIRAAKAFAKRQRRKLNKEYTDKYRSERDRIKKRGRKENTRRASSWYKKQRKKSPLFKKKTDEAGKKLVKSGKKGLSQSPDKTISNVDREMNKRENTRKRYSPFRRRVKKKYKSMSTEDKIKTGNKVVKVLEKDKRTAPVAKKIKKSFFSWGKRKAKKDVKEKLKKKRGGWGRSRKKSSSSSKRRRRRFF